MYWTPNLPPALAGREIEDLLCKRSNVRLVRILKGETLKAVGRQCQRNLCASMLAHGFDTFTKVYAKHVLVLLQKYIEQSVYFGS